MNPNGQSARNSLGSHRVRIENYHYSLSQILGSGYSSNVYRGRNDTNGKTVAIKVVNLHKLRQRQLEGFLMNQVRILQEIRHENIVKYVDALMTTNNCYIITQCCSQGDLASIISKKGTLSFDQNMKLVLQLVAAIKYLHSNNIIHRDIKPCNILMYRNRARLADFGFAVKTSSATVKDGYKIGTPLYMSPQALFNKQYSKKSDIWALGVTIYEILEGCPPWCVQNERELKQAIRGQVKFNKIQRQDLQNIVLDCLQFDKQVRITAQEVFSRMEYASGIKDNIKVNVEQDKQNNMERNNNVDENAAQNQQVKKSIRVNYSILKWLINYSRFAAKLLPKISELDLPINQKDPLLEMAARCLHMTISKLHRIEQQYCQIGLTNYAQFRRTCRFARIRAVTQQYHKKYLLMLSKLPYTYSLPPTLALQFKPQFYSSIESLSITERNSQKHIDVLEGLIVLAEANIYARTNNIINLTQAINFQQLIDSAHNATVLYDEIKLAKLDERKSNILQDLYRKSESVSTDSEK